MITLQSVQAARARISPYVVRTPTVVQGRLTELLGRPVVAKLELLQHAGSFKARGAFNRMLDLSDDERGAGVVAVSGGNHGLAVAFAARELGVSAKVIMPASTPAGSIAGARADGAEVVLTATIAEAFAAAAREATLGRLLVHPFDDPVVIAGQGTLALELLEDAADLTDVIASIGGGGMISGVLAAVKGLRPDIRVWGVETVGADAMTRAIAAGRPVQLDAITSIAKTLGAPAVSQRTLDMVRTGVEDVVVVTDPEVVRAIEVLADRAKIIAEPAAACTWSAALRLRDRLPPEARVALIICGGNVSLDDIEGWRRQLLPSSG